MQNTKGTQARNQPQQSNQSNGEQQYHQASVGVVDNSPNLNENVVRDQHRSCTEAVKGGERSDADNKN